VLAAPNGSSAAPTFRALVAADIPTLNQSTTGSAAKWTSAVNLAGNSVDGSASVAFSNKFIVQGTTDTGLSGAQFLGALGTGIVKNTTTTGVLSIASAGDFPTLNQSTTGSAATLTTPRAINGTNFDGSAAITITAAAGTLTGTTLNSGVTASSLTSVGTLASLTTSGNVIVGGNLTVNGTTTSINSSTLQVDDKNLELGSVAGVAGIAGTVENGTSTVLTATPYNFIVGQSVTRTAGVAYAGGTIQSIVSPTEFNVSGTFGATGSITLTIGGADDTTADGAGITVKGATDKTFNYTNASTSWTSNQDLNLVTGKVYEINGTSVLSSTTLGSAVVNSSLTSVGTIATGTWNGTAIAGQYGGTGVANTGKTITLGGNLTTSGAFATTLTATGTTSVTLPTSGTLLTTAGSGSSLTFGTGSLSLAGNLTTSGAFTTTLTATANTSVTLPTTGTLVNTAVATLSSLASVGTITTGVWNGTAIGLLYGGTGATTAAAARTNLGATTKVTAAGSGSGTSIAVAHGLGTAVIAQLLDSTGAVVEVDVVTTATASGTTTFTFSSTQTLSNFTYVIIG
jgi:hypothetical protein